MMKGWAMEEASTKFNKLKSFIHEVEGGAGGGRGRELGS